MRAAVLVFSLGLPIVATGCLSAATRAAFDETERVLSRATIVSRASSSAPSDARSFTGPLVRAALVRVAVSRDPELTALAHRARALLFGARAEASLPPPEAEGQVWNLPIIRPYSLGEAGMYMVGVRQMLPAPGGLDGRARAMIEEARGVLAEASTREREVIRAVGEAYADLIAATLHHGVHHDQLSQLERAQEVIRARYAAGGGALAELARIELAQAGHRRTLVRYQADAARARATLNAWLHRPPDAPLGDPGELEAETVTLGFDELVARAIRARGEILAGEARERAADARLRAMESDASWPSFTFGMSYMQDPMRTPGFGALVGMSLPWLTGGARARVSQAREEATAERAMTDAARWSVRRDIAMVQAQLASAVAVLRSLRADAMPAARRAVEAVRASYTTGDSDLNAWLESDRETLELEMDEADAIADLARATNALDAAVGETLPRVSVRVDGGAR